MKILVCIKQVPDTVEVKIDPKTGTLIRDGVPSIINHDDKTGIEAALQIKEQLGGTVTVVSMGPPQADVALREALAMGCDDAYLVYGTNTVDAAGNKLTADNQTLWDNITNCIGQIQGLVNTFAEFLSGITAAEALAPVQVDDGWVKQQENNSGKLSANTGLLLGGGLIASAFLLNKKK